MLFRVVKILTYIDTTNSHIASFSLLLLFLLLRFLGNFLALSQLFFDPCSTYLQGTFISQPGTQTPSGAADLGALVIVPSMYICFSLTSSTGAKTWGIHVAAIIEVVIG